MQDALSMPLDEVEAMNKVAFNLNANDPRARMKEPAALRSMIETFAELIPGDRVLDVGCGWGDHAKHFKAHGLHYTGIDFSESRIEIAKSENPDTSFAVMSYRRLAFPNSHFSGIWCCCALEAEPKRNLPNVLREMRRVLIPEGVLCVLSPAYDSDEGIVDWDNRRSYSSLYDLDELENVLDQCGFHLLKSKWLYNEGTNAFFTLKRP